MDGSLCGITLPYNRISEHFAGVRHQRGRRSAPGGSSSTKILTALQRGIFGKRQPRFEGVAQPFVVLGGQIPGVLSLLKP